MNTNNLTLNEILNKKIAIWGIGKEGLSILKEIRRRDKNTEILIINDSNINLDDLKDYQPLSFILSESLEANIKNIDILIKSPGVSYYRDEIKKLQECNVKITSITNLWLAENQDKNLIFITGTKGKSTTTKLTELILQYHNIKAIAGGNIGLPLFDLPKDYDVYVLELSSYQIYDLNFSAKIGAIVNLYPAHQIWHLNTNQYYKDKTTIKSNLDRLIVDKKFAYPINLEHNNISYFNNLESFNFDNRHIYFGKDVILEIEKLKIKGDHNYSNLCCALTLASEFVKIDKELLKNLYNFIGIPHRLENIGVYNNITFINDSISTIPETTLAALKALKSSAITLLVGGQNVEADWTVVFEYLKDNPINYIIGLPDSGQRILQCVKKFGLNIPTYLSLNLEDAVAFAKTNTPQNGIILLSPGTPSYGKFKNFEERGVLFNSFCLD